MFPKLVFNCIWLISCTARGGLPLDDSRSCKMFGGLFPFAETVPLSVLFRLVLITFPSRHIEWLSELPCPMASFGIFFFHVAFSVLSPCLVWETRFFLFYGIIHNFPYLLFYSYVLLFSFHDTRKNIILPRVLPKSFSLYGPTCQRRARPKEPDLPWRHFARSREQAMSLCLFWKRESHGLFRNYER